MPDPPGAASFRVPAEAYDGYIGRYGAALAAGMLAAAAIVPGQRVLDVGCGPGALTRALAAALGPGRVSAVDPSPPFVEACRRRVPGADVRLAAAEALPFADDAFDAVLAQLVVNFMADPAGGVAEMRRVARPGGLVAGCVWDYAGEMTLLRSFWDAAVRIDPAAADDDEGRAMRFCEPEDLAGLWRAAGLLEVVPGALEAVAHYESFDALWAPLELGVGPAGAYAAALDPERRAALREELSGSLGASGGPFTLTARAWSAVGRAPAR